MVAPQPGLPRALVGTIVSRRWIIVSKLGEGGMGEVFAADPVSGGVRVAIKVLRPEFVADPQILSRFLEEARTSIRLVHPNIVRVFEGAQAEDGSPYFVMELLDGVPLSAYTQNGGRVPIAQAVPILQGILAGLAAAHAQGIVHRDLKPDNVLLTRDAAGTFAVKLLDFGIAKVMDVAGGMGVRTRTGMLLGTPAYMSPEQARNARDVDARTDLWSAGVLFYEMLTGRAAFPAPTEFARLAALLSSEPEPVHRIDPSLGPLVPFFERALKKDRGERFASAIEMAHALAAAAPGFGRPSTSPMPLSHLPDVQGGRDQTGAPETRQQTGGPEARQHQTGARPRTTANPDVPRPSNAPPTAAMPQSTSDPPRKTTPVPLAPAHPVQPSPAPQAVVAHSPGGTLASQLPRVEGEAPAPAHNGNVNVSFAVPKSSLGETLQSGEGKGQRASKSGVPGRGVPTPLVAALVLAALVAGFLLGWAFGRM
jgi:serine/threonine-protein kinase